MEWEPGLFMAHGIAVSEAVSGKEWLAWMSWRSGRGFICIRMTCRWRRCAPAVPAARTSTRCRRPYTCVLISARRICRRGCGSGSLRVGTPASAAMACSSSRHSVFVPRPGIARTRCSGSSNCCTRRAGRVVHGDRRGPRVLPSVDASTGKQNIVETRNYEGNRRLIKVNSRRCVRPRARHRSVTGGHDRREDSQR